MKQAFFKTIVLAVGLFLSSESSAQSLTVSDYTQTIDSYMSPTVPHSSGTNYVALNPVGIYYEGGAYVDLTTDGDIFDFCDAAQSVGAVLPELSDPSITWDLPNIDQNGQTRLSVNFTAPGQTALFRVRATEYNSGAWSYAYYYIEFTAQ